MRKIPTSMATQHPDNASVPYWHKRAFISTFAEIKESYLCFSDLKVDEYNWDWEGKFVDEAVIDRLLHEHFAYFQKNPLGKEKFLTFRIPNPKVEKQFRLARALMVAITNSQLMKSMGFTDHPIFEMILPLTETAEEIIAIQTAFKKLASIDHPLLKMKDSIQHIEIIPLIEQVSRIMTGGELIRKYIRLHQNIYKSKPIYLRPYLARSDPALNSGLVPTMLAIKTALSEFERVKKETGVKLYPIIGTGSLPFRGSVTPETIDQAIEEYAGVSTLVIQSGFRYDYPKTSVKKAIEELKRQLPLKKALILKAKEAELIKKIIPLFEHPYRESVEKLAPLINAFSHQFPKRRERMQHIGLFGYSRGVGSAKLPRAIPFTGILYSIGLPPEIIGTGRGIRAAKNKKYWREISHLYKYFKDDIVRAGYFLNKANLEKISKQADIWKEIKEDIKAIEESLQVELGPKNKFHKEHRDLTKRIWTAFNSSKKYSNLITSGGILRNSLG